MRLRWLLANNTALVLVTLSLGFAGPDKVFAQDMILPDAGVATPPTEPELTTGVDAKVDMEPSAVSEEAVANGMATPPSEAVPADFVTLQLDVKINGINTGYISTFYQMNDGGLAATRSELEQLRIAVSVIS